MASRRIALICLLLSGESNEKRWASKRYFFRKGKPSECITMPSKLVKKINKLCSNIFVAPASTRVCSEWVTQESEKTRSFTVLLHTVVCWNGMPEVFVTILKSQGIQSALKQFLTCMAYSTKIWSTVSTWNFFFNRSLLKEPASFVISSYMSRGFSTREFQYFIRKLWCQNTRVAYRCCLYTYRF